MRTHTNRWIVAVALSALLLAAAPAAADDVFDVTVIPCTDELCGESDLPSAPLRKGRVKVSEDGKVDVSLDGAVRNATLCVIYLPFNGDDPIEVGSVQTDDSGDTDDDIEGFVVFETMGLFEFRTGTCDGESLYVTAFSTRERNSEDDDDDDDGDIDDDDDGMSDDDDDSDRDGVSDDDDANPNRANAFDAMDDDRELRSEYREELKELREEFREERKELSEDFREDKKELRDDFRERRGEL